jgi:hypothetical protein
LHGNTEWLQSLTLSFVPGLQRLVPELGLVFQKKAFWDARHHGSFEVNGLCNVHIYGQAGEGHRVNLGKSFFVLQEINGISQRLLHCSAIVGIYSHQDIMRRGLSTWEIQPAVFVNNELQCDGVRQLECRARDLTIALHLVWIASKKLGAVLENGQEETRSLAEIVQVQIPAKRPRGARSYVSELCLFG